MAVKEIPFAHLLSSVVDNRGKTCPTSDTGIPLIATNCIRNDILYPAYEKIRFVSQETYDTWFRGHPEPGDLIFVTKGTPGRVCLAPNPVNFCIAQDMVAIRADEEKVYPPYLFAVLRSSEIQRRIENMHVGTLIPHFKKGDFDKLFIPVPDRNTQTLIGDVYLTLSYKIELNQQMNQTLEAIARALFKSWFIDFDPVRAKLNGRQPAGMDAETAALFPAKFEDGGEIGGIPKGWQQCTLGDFLNLKRGYDLPQRLRDNGTSPIISSSGLSGYHSTAKIKAPGVVTGRYGTVGQVFYIEEDFWPLNTTLYVQDFKGNNPKVAYYILERVDFNVYADKAAVPGVNRNHVHQEKIVAPPKLIQESFFQAVKPVWKQQNLNSQQTETLTNIRDALLPKLLSGEICVKDAEKIVEVAT